MTGWVLGPRSSVGAPDEWRHVLARFVALNHQLAVAGAERGIRRTVEARIRASRAPAAEGRFPSLRGGDG